MWISPIFWLLKWKSTIFTRSGAFFFFLRINKGKLSSSSFNLQQLSNVVTAAALASGKFLLTTWQCQQRDQSPVEKKRGHNHARTLTLQSCMEKHEDMITGGIGDKSNAPSKKHARSYNSIIIYEWIRAGIRAGNGDRLISDVQGRWRWN